MIIKSVQLGCIIPREQGYGFAYSVIVNRDKYWTSVKTYASEAAARRAGEDQVKRMDAKLQLRPQVMGLSRGQTT